MCARVPTYDNISKYIVFLIIRARFLPLTSPQIFSARTRRKNFISILNQLLSRDNLLLKSAIKLPDHFVLQ